MKLISDFKEFAMRGNVLDLAVGVIVGGAFGKITTSLVNDVIMPPIGMALGRVNFNDLKFVIQPGKKAVTDGAKIISPEISEVAIRYGAFIQTTIDFLIIAFCVFLVVKLFQSAVAKKEAETPVVEPEAPQDIVLLTEIRDLLKKAP